MREVDDCRVVVVVVVDEGQVTVGSGMDILHGNLCTKIPTVLIVVDDTLREDHPTSVHLPCHSRGRLHRRSSVYSPVVLSLFLTLPRLVYDGRYSTGEESLVQHPPSLCLSRLRSMVFGHPGFIKQELLCIYLHSWATTSRSSLASSPVRCSPFRQGTSS